MSELPSVSVIVVNYNGLRHLEDCFGSLQKLNYPQDRLELILVDNGSTDGSVEHVRRRFPQVKVLENGANLGFGKGNNIGARQATGQMVAFLNNDTRVEADWLLELVKALRPEEGIICVGSKILTWDGQGVDFVGGKLNFYGQGFQTDFGAFHSRESYNEPELIPFACGGAMLVDKKVFLECGGFDEDYFAFFEDVDLGWRLWLLGYQAVFAPRSIVYHRHHGTSQRMPLHQTRLLHERNALYTIIKNYEAPNLEKALPIALFLLIKRGLVHCPVDRQTYAPEGRRSRNKEEVPKLAMSYFLGADEVANNLPQVMAKREAIQRARVRSDEEIFRQFRFRLTDPSFPGHGYARSHETLISAFGLPDFMIRRHRVRLLMIAHESIGPNMAGPGVRYWEMARALSRDCEVTLACPGQPGLTSPDFQLAGYSRSALGTIIPLANAADAVLAFGYVLHQFPQLSGRLHDLNKPLIVDIYDPFILENLEIHSRLPLEEQDKISGLYLGILNNQLRAGDFFLCASERQRDYWLGMLAANGRVNPSTYADDKTLRRLIAVVPFGLPSQPPQHRRQVLKGVHPKIAADDKVILWGGGLWDWFDPLTLIRAIARITLQRRDVKLFFMGKQHLDPTLVPEMAMPTRAEQLSRELGLYNQWVFFNDWVPYQERENYLLEADVGVSLHFDYIEARFAFRTRLMDYIWAGLPMVVTRGDALGDTVEAAGLGRTVRAEDVDGVAAALLELLASPALRESMQPDFRRVAAQHTWERAVEPVVAFLREPRRAADTENEYLKLALGTAVVATPWYRLPARAWHYFREGGLPGLQREMARYIRWRRMQG